MNVFWRRQVRSVTQTARNYGRILLELGVTPGETEELRRMYAGAPELFLALNSPVATEKEKYAVIVQIFPRKLWNFMKVLCDYQSVDQISDILKAYDAYFDEQSDILRAALYYVTAPDDVQRDGIKEYLGRKYGRRRVELEMIESPELIGGFVLRVGDMEEDYSLRGRLLALRQKLTGR